MNRFLSIASATLALGLAASVGIAKNVSIPFADHGGIRNWEADRDVGIWVQDIHRKWYYATFLGPCQELRFAEGVAFITGPTGTLDRFSALRVRGERCVFSSFDESKGPPPGKKSKKPAPQVTKEAPKDAAPAPQPEPKPAG